MEHNFMRIGKNRLLRLALMSVPLLSAPAFTSCADEDAATGGEPSVPGRLAFDVSVDGEWKGETRGNMVNSMEDPFGVFIYKFADNADHDYITPDADMLNELVTKGMDGWLTSSTFHWPSSGKVLFFGYYPYQDPEDDDVIAQTEAGTVPMILPTANSQGYTSIQFRTPLNAYDQIDLMGAATAVMDGVAEANAPESVPLTFHHLLAGVQFKTGTFSDYGKIVKIVLNRVLRDGTVSFNPRSTVYSEDDSYYVWTPTENSWASFTTEPNYTVTSAEQGGVTINNGVNTLFLMPQVLDAQASIDLYYDNGTVRKLSTRSIAGKQLYMGKITVFTLSVESLQKLTVDVSVTDWTSSGETESGSITNGDPIAPEAVVDDWDDGETATESDFGSLTEYPEEP